MEYKVKVKIAKIADLHTSTYINSTNNIKWKKASCKVIHVITFTSQD
jgi:hypothetical protein